MENSQLLAPLINIIKTVRLSHGKITEYSMCLVVFKNLYALNSIMDGIG